MFSLRRKIFQRFLLIFLVGLGLWLWSDFFLQHKNSSIFAQTAEQELVATNSASIVQGKVSLTPTAIPQPSSSDYVQAGTASWQNAEV